MDSYSYQHCEGSLEQSLEQQLRQAAVRIRQLPECERRTLVSAEKTVSAVVDLLGTFLSLFKGNHWTMPEVRRVADARPDRVRLRSFLSVFEEVLSWYKAELRRAVYARPRCHSATVRCTVRSSLQPQRNCRQDPCRLRGPSRICLHLAWFHARFGPPDKREVGGKTTRHNSRHAAIRDVVSFILGVSFVRY